MRVCTSQESGHWLDAEVVQVDVLDDGGGQSLGVVLDAVEQGLKPVILALKQKAVQSLLYGFSLFR